MIIFAAHFDRTMKFMTVLMFDLGLSLRVSDFVNIFKRPKAMIAGIFFIQNKTVIISQFGTLGLATGGLILGSIAAAAVICLIFRLRTTERRTIVIEVGMQNAAQTQWPDPPTI